MLKIVNDMKSAMDTSAASLLVSLDLTAAFDTINHPKLLVRLAQEFGLDSSSLMWLSSYLMGRRQFVNVGDSKGDITSCSSGVP